MNNNNNTNNNSNIGLIPVVTYSNADTNKSIIYEENKDKSGVYRWNNLITGKSYIGSSISLSGRFSIYYSLSALKKKQWSSAIYSSLLKYGYSKFSLDILEYCEPEVLISREQFYIDFLKPEYNILKIAGNRLGSKHSEATKALMSIKQKGINHHFFGKIHTEETRKKIGSSLKSIVRVNTKPKVVKAETRLKLSLRSHGLSVKVFDKSNNLIKQFPTITSVAKYFNISDTTVSRYLDKDISYKGFTFKS